MVTPTAIDSALKTIRAAMVCDSRNCLGSTMCWRHPDSWVRRCRRETGTIDLA